MAMSLFAEKSASPSCADASAVSLALLDRWQHDFPLTERPFLEIGAELGQSEGRIIAQYEALQSERLAQKKRAEEELKQKELEKQHAEEEKYQEELKAYWAKYESDRQKQLAKQIDHGALHKEQNAECMFKSG